MNDAIDRIDEADQSVAALETLRALMQPDDDLAAVPKSGMNALLTMILKGLQR